MLAAQQLAEAEFAQLAAAQQSTVVVAASAAPSNTPAVNQTQKKVLILLFSIPLFEKQTITGCCIFEKKSECNFCSY